MRSPKFSKNEGNVKFSLKMVGLVKGGTSVKRGNSVKRGEGESLIFDCRQYKTHTPLTIS